MRKWGIVISLVYALMVVGMLVPAGVLLGGEHGLLSGAFYRDMKDAYGQWVLWVPVAMLLFGQVALLMLSVDTSQRKLKPRAPVLRSAFVAAMLFLILSVGAFFSAGVALYADRFFDKMPDTGLWIYGGMAFIWMSWGVVFYLNLRRETRITPRVVSWLLRGSVLELLIAVPAHVIVRRRNDCSAPVATSFGITSGIAIMLLSFGPGVLLLYKKRIDAYRDAHQNRHAPVA